MYSTSPILTSINDSVFSKSNFSQLSLVNSILLDHILIPADPQPLFFILKIPKTLIKALIFSFSRLTRTITCVSFISHCRSKPISRTKKKWQRDQRKPHTMYNTQVADSIAAGCIMLNEKCVIHYTSIHWLSARQQAEHRKTCILAIYYNTFMNTFF